MEGRRGPRLSPDQGPKWTGGIAGYWSYDIIRSIERLPELAEDDLGLPDYWFIRLDELWIIDHEERSLYCSVHTNAGAGGSGVTRSVYDSARSKAEAMGAEWSAWLAGDGIADARTAERRRLLQEEGEGSVLPFSDMPEGVSSPFPQEQYKDAVRRIQEYIASGDVFQVNLSLRQQCGTDSTPEELYEWLRLINPSPYMGLLRAPDFQLVSASPELLVEMADGRAVDAANRRHEEKGPDGGGGRAAGAGAPRER